MVYVGTAAKTVISEKHGMTTEVWTGHSVLEVGVLKAVRLCQSSTAGLVARSPVPEGAGEYRASLRELSYHKRLWRGRPTWGSRWLSGPDRISRAIIRAPPVGL